MSSNMFSSASISSGFDIERTRQISNDNTTEVKKKIENNQSSSVDNDGASVLSQDILLKKIEESAETAKNENAPESAEQLEQAIAIVSDFINQPPRNVNFTKDNDSGKTVIKVIDNESKELIKQFPSEELISIAQKIQALHQEVGEKAGILLDKRV
ncbi:flagellar protein FlaG [Colwellia sp. M166]|uniref:flagellar protein FlaG n=1 Tax=Colwellia sp. M166 TaxID=2583805 RepID=UPI00211EE535|nr:flagellar protein FlaG [Colwellia sp. M166]UUO23150.1 flagellar protein FlaG [Colwellia sp. M166]